MASNIRIDNDDLKIIVCYVFKNISRVIII